MNIKDIDMTQDLSTEERAVRGGSSNFGYIGSPVLATSGGSSARDGQSATAVVDGSREAACC